MTNAKKRISAEASRPAWQRSGAPFLWMPYTQMQTSPWPLPVVATEGVELILDDGRRLIDGMASWWTACHGYNHPHLLQSIQDQLQVMPHVMLGGIHHPQVVRLAERLARLLPGDLNHIFFCDSGSVAVEVALKMAIQYWINRAQPTRKRFVCFQHAYHGDTTGAMSVCDPLNSMHAHFKGYLLEHFSRPIPEGREAWSDFDCFLAERTDELAGVIIEPLVQGAGGMKFHSAATLAELRATCDRHNLLLIADEIATGFGRTGSMFACEQASIVPDIMCLGKALTGGTVSLAATAANTRVYEAFLSDFATDALMHGPTYMGNPLACAAANASLDLFEQEPRLAQAAHIERRLREGLAECADLPQVVDVRCLGAIGVIQVKELYQLERLRETFVERGIWLRPFRDMIYMTPPLTINDEQLDHLLQATTDAVQSWSTWQG